MRLPTTPLPATPATPPPSANRRSSVFTEGSGGPRQRPTPPSEQFSSPSSFQANSNQTQYLFVRTCALAETMLDDARMEDVVRREVEHDVLVGLKQDLRLLAAKLDADNWMYSTSTPAGLRL